MPSLISIIIPTYNRAATVGRAVESVLAQTYPTCEIIVVDDGSTDETPQVLASFAKRIRTYSQPNMGRSAARNIGLNLAAGDYVVFLDSDDVLMPNMVESQFNLLQQLPGAAFVTGCALMTDLRGKLVRPQVVMGAPLMPPPFASLVMGNSLLIHTTLIRRESLREVGGFDETLHVSEDWDLWLRLTARYDVGFNPSPVAYYSVGMNEYAERLDKYQSQVYTPKVIERSFAYLPANSPLHALKPRAVARAQVEWGACLECALGRPEQAKQFIQQALKIYPTLEADIEVVPRGVGQFATWYQPEGGAFIRTFFEMMSSQLADSKKLRAQTLTLYYAKQAHLAWLGRQRLSALRALLQATGDVYALRWAIQQFVSRLRKRYT